MNTSTPDTAAAEPTDPFVAPMDAVVVTAGDITDVVKRLKERGDLEKLKAIAAVAAAVTGRKLLPFLAGHGLWYVTRDDTQAVNLERLATDTTLNAIAGVHTPAVGRPELDVCLALLRYALHALTPAESGGVNLPARDTRDRAAAALVEVLHHQGVAFWESAPPQLCEAYAAACDHFPTSSQHKGH